MWRGEQLLHSADRHSLDVHPGEVRQKALATTIDRGHPPTTLGTYPSGGCARLLCTVGVMIFLALLLVPNLSRRLRFTTWTIFAGLVWMEAFSRTYLSKHWTTDAAGGVIFGVLLLLAVVGNGGVDAQYCARLRRIRRLEPGAEPQPTPPSPTLRSTQTSSAPAPVTPSPRP